MTKKELIIKYEKQLENQEIQMEGMSNKGYGLGAIHTKIEKIRQIVQDLKEME